MTLTLHTEQHRAKEKQMSAISFTARKLSTLVDGTVRLTIDFEPSDAVTAMQMFGRPGTAGAAAVLTPEAAQQHQQQKMVGGPLSKEAAGLCKREDFQRFASEHLKPNGINLYGNSEDEAADYIRERCYIDSRAELDHERGAAQEFAHIKREFHDWVKRAV